MRQNRIIKDSSEIVSSFYVKNILLLSAFVCLALFIAIFSGNEIKYSVKILNANVQNSIRNNIKIIQNDLFVRAKMLNSGAPFEVIMSDDKEMADLYKAVYLVDADRNLELKREFGEHKKLDSFDMTWLDGLHKKRFVVSERVIKNGKLEAIYAGYELDNGKKVVAELNINFLYISITNVLSESNDRAFLLDKYGNLLAESFVSNFDAKKYQNYLSLGDKFKHAQIIFSPFALSFEDIEYMRDYEVFVVTVSTKQLKIAFLLLLLLTSIGCFIGFCALWYRDAKFTKNNILKPLENIMNFIKDRDSVETRELGVKDLNCINEGISELYNRLDGVAGELEGYKNRFGYIFNESPLILLVYDSYTGDIVDASEAAIKFYGYSHKEMMRLNLKDILATDFKQVAYERREAMKNSESYKAKHRLKSGELRDVEIIVAPINDNGKKLNFVVIEDITQKEVLDENNRAIRKYYRYAPSAVLVADPDNPFLIRQSTGNVKEVTGISHDEILNEGVDIRSIVASSNLDMFVNEIEIRKKLFVLGAANGSDNFSLDIKMRSPFGGEAMFLVLVQFVRSQNREFEKIVYCLEDASRYWQLNARLESELRNQKNLLWATRAISFSWNANDNKLYIDKDFLRILGHENSSETGIFEFERFNEMMAQKYSSFTDFFANLQVNEGEYLDEIKFYDKDKNQIWMQVRAKALNFDANGAVSEIWGIIKDVSVKNHAYIYEQLLSRLFSCVKDGVVLTDLNYSILDANGAFLQGSGYERDETVGRNLMELKFNLAQGQTEILMENGLNEQGFWSGRVWSKRKNGENIIEMVYVGLMCDAKGSPTNYVAIFSNVSDAKTNQEYLEHIAYHDPLTRLPNRILFSSKLDNAISQLQDGAHVAIAYLDLDGFKAINDTYGHQAGDKILVEISSQISALFGGEDMFARVGGDEFIAIIKYENAGQMYEIVENMLLIASSEVEFEGATLQISASIGVSIASSSEGITSEELVEQADWAMYQAKLGGKNRYYLFDQSKDRHFKNQYEYGSRVLKALENSEFFIEYQPEINIQTGEILSFEALIRWQSQNGIIYPDDFLPLIKHQYILNDIAIFAIKKSLEARNLWQRYGINAKACVNLGIEQLCSEDFFVRLQELDERNERLNLNGLIIEIVDANLADDFYLVNDFLRRYSRLGVSFAMDDFASKNSSFEALGTLGIDRIKADKRLTGRLLNTSAAVMTLKMLRQLSEIFDKEVTIKNIESKEMLEIVCGFGFSCFQGNFFTKPLRLDEVLKFKFDGVGALNVRNYMIEAEFERLKDCIWLKEQAQVLISCFKREHRKGAQECKQVSFEILAVLENTKNMHSQICVKLMDAIKQADISLGLKMVQEADNMCNEILGIEGKNE